MVEKEGGFGDGRKADCKKKELGDTIKRTLKIPNRAGARPKHGARAQIVLAHSVSGWCTLVGVAPRNLVVLRHTAIAWLPFVPFVSLLHEHIRQCCLSDYFVRRESAPSSELASGFIVRQAHFSFQSHSGIDIHVGHPG